MLVRDEQSVTKNLLLKKSKSLSFGPTHMSHKIGFAHFSRVSIIDFEQVNAGWEDPRTKSDFVVIIVNFE